VFLNRAKNILIVDWIGFDDNDCRRGGSGKYRIESGPISRSFLGAVDSYHQQLKKYSHQRVAAQQSLSQQCNKQHQLFVKMDLETRCS
jgi:hypothetical protein